MKNDFTITDWKARRDALEAEAPRVLNPLLTYTTGQRPSGEAKSRKSEKARVALSFGTHVAGIAAAALAAQHWNLAMSPAVLAAGWTLSIGGARDLQLSVYHHAAHANVISKTVSKVLGRTIATMLLIEPYDAYAPKHCREHHGRHTVSTDVDPTVDFLANKIGLRPGAPVAENMRKFRKAMISAPVHARLFGARLQAQFGAQAGWKNRLASAAYHGLVSAGLVSAFGWAPFLLAYVLPLTVGYQAAAIARLGVEHLWPAERPADGKRSRPDHDALTVAVRAAPKLPDRWTMGATLRFTAEALMHAWVRFTILPGDSGPNHGWHHGEARGDWVNHIDAAEAWEKARLEKGGERPIEAESYGEALHMAMASFEAATWDSLRAPARLAKREAA